MKKSMILWLGLAIFSFSLATFQSCETDPCDGITCENGGFCNLGACLCTTGFEGSTCATEWSAKFVSGYDATDMCDSDNYVWTSTVTRTDVDAVSISNFGGFAVDVPATVVQSVVDSNIGDQLSINNTDIAGRVFTGTGIIDASGNLVITYTVTFTDMTQDNCVATLTPQ